MAISVSVKTSEQEILGGSVEPLEPPLATGLMCLAYMVLGAVRSTVQIVQGWRSTFGASFFKMIHRYFCEEFIQRQFIVTKQYYPVHLPNYIATNTSCLE